jgi:maltooligosyltrehalose trehalohydrolase
MSPRPVRRLPIGAEVQPDGSTHFRVWAPAPTRITLLLERKNQRCESVELERESGGYYSGSAAATAGDRYRYRLDGNIYPDPASRAQPEGPAGPSEIVDHSSFSWNDQRWRGITLRGQVIYELHVGTFTAEGTWSAAAERLQWLASVGVSVVEVMPIAEFPGAFGWGYDGVFPYAPAHLYGRPDDVRRFVDRAHQLGLGVILDVVYNHFGPSGCVVHNFSASYFSTVANEWGEGINFDGPDAGPVREFFSENAAYWISEFHFDGLRLDATQSLHDRSSEHIVAEVARKARLAAGDRSILLVAEDERQQAKQARPRERDGYGLDALWNDDFHHSAFVALTGRHEAYYSDHRGRPQEFISAAKYGFLFQGQRYAWQKGPRGSRTRGLAPSAFVNFLENHDQVANSAEGQRLSARTSPGRLRAMTALLLLLPGTPMLFQGQEFGSTSPFLYFADHEPPLAEAVKRGRAEFLSQFASLTQPAMQSRLAVPHARETFERSKLDWRESERHDAFVRLHRDLIALRRADDAFARQEPGAVDGAVLAAEAFALRFAAPDPLDERLLLVNLGIDLEAGSFPEPLLAAGDGLTWVLAWASEDPEYGGLGASVVVDDDGWRIPGHSAVVLRPVER